MGVSRITKVTIRLLPRNQLERIGRGPEKQFQGQFPLRAEAGIWSRFWAFIHTGAR